MKILVTTPTGTIGRRIVPELLAPEFSVRVIVRDPERLPAAIREQVEVVCGSTSDAVALRRVLDGVEAMFWCVPTESLQETNVEQHYERFACAAWEAIREARTPRVVTISAGGKGRASKAERICGLHAMEEILNESGAAIRHLRCGLFMDNLLSQVRQIREEMLITYPIPGQIPVSMVAVTDIADIVLRWLVRRDWDGIQSFAVQGPEALSCNQVAAVVERTLERPVRYQEISPASYVRSLLENGASQLYAQSQVEMFADLAQCIMDADSRTNVAMTTTSLAAWAESELLPAVEALTEQRKTTPATVESLTCKALKPGNGDQI